MSNTFRDDSFKGKVVLVTGGTSGIGQATAEYFNKLGAKVIAVGLGSDKTIISEGVSLDLREVDVTDEKALKSVIDSLDQLDVLIPAAGISLGEKELEWDNFRRVLPIQLDAVYRVISLSKDLLAKSKGSIITISSMYAFFGGNKSVAYSSAKGAIVQLTKSLAEAYKKDGIRVNSVAPGWIDTPLLTEIDDFYPGSLEKILERTPLGRYGKTTEIAGAIAFLASDAASFINGVNLPVDGGYLVTAI